MKKTGKLFGGGDTVRPQGVRGYSLEGEGVGEAARPTGEDQRRVQEIPKSRC